MESLATEQVNILPLKWGTLYPADYVNRIYAGVKRHLRRPFRFVCVTDDPAGLAEGNGKTLTLIGLAFSKAKRTIVAAKVEEAR